MSDKNYNRIEWNDSMTRELSEIIGKELNEWCNNETELEDCVETCEEIFKWSRNDNGYEFAKKFEDEGFSPDSQLVEILDGVTYHVSNIKQKAIKKWVSENNLELKYEVGQIVLVNLVRIGQVECEIMKLYPETLQYGLWHESLGYEKGKGHRLVNQEQIIDTNANS